MMRNPLSKKITGIEPSGIRKFFDLVSEMPDAISLGVGEPDFDTPWRIREEGIYTLEQGKTFYTSNAGLKDLKIEISKYLERKIHVEYDPDHEIMVTVGGSEGIDVALRAMLDPGDEVLIPQPSYVSYVPCTILADGNPVVIPLQQKNEFKLTAEELEAAITPKTKMLVMPFPNNPTGSIMTKEDLEPIAEVVKRHDLYVLSDEIYSELTYKTEHVSISSLPGMKERTLVINGFSKGFAMTGWRLGYLAASSRMLSNLLKVHQYTTTCVPTFVQEGLAETMNAPETMAEVKQMVAAFDRRRKLFIQGLDAIGNLEYIKPQGAFYIFIDVSKTGMDGDEFASRLLEERYVACVPGSKLGSHCGNFVRISYATSDENIKEGLARIDEFLNKK